MRILKYAWHGSAVQKILVFMFILIISINAMCGNQEAGHTLPAESVKNKPVKNEPDSIPFRFLPSSEQDKIRPRAKYHQYGDIKLENQAGQYVKYSNGQAVIQEVHPGMLLYNRSNYKEDHTLNWRLDIYNEKTKKLIKKLNFEDLSPYSRKKFKDIGYGGYGGGDAGDIMPPSSNEGGALTKLPSPNNYRTNNSVNISPGGHICVLHELHKLSDAMFVGYEATLAVYSPNGKKLRSVTSNTSIEFPYVSTDGKYLAYIYGTGRTDNFFDANQGNLIVIEMKSGKTILHYTFESNEKIRNMHEVEKDGWLVIKGRDPFTDNSSNKIVLLDVNKRELQTLKITPAQWKSIVDNWISYTDLVQKYSFTVKQY